MRSQCLQEILKRCLRFVHTQPNDYDEDFDESPQYIEIDTKTSLSHDVLLKAELFQLKAQLKEVEGLETTINEGLDGRDGNAIHPTEVDCNPGSTPTSNVTKVNVFTTNPTSTRLRVKIDHLQKLLRRLNIEFASTTQNFEELLDCKEITYDLLWCLFRQDNVVGFRMDMSESFCSRNEDSR